MYKTLQLFTNVQNITTIYKGTKHYNYLQMYKTLQLFTKPFTFTLFTDIFQVSFSLSVKHFMTIVTNLNKKTLI